MPGRLLASFHRTATSPPLNALKVKSSSHRVQAPERESMDSFKRLSLGGRHHSDRKSPRMEPQKSAKLDMVIESPPLVMYNAPETSTGALFSGQLKVNVADISVAFETFHMQLFAVTTIKKPVGQHCPDCAIQKNELKKWEFTTGKALKRGEYTYPFSYLLPGHLPATSHGTLASIDYRLIAEAKTTTGETITYTRDIDLKRSIIPGNEKHSMRVFPPTNLTAAVTLQPIIHPIGDFTVEMRLSGIVTRQGDSVLRWRLRKMDWRIEEHHKMVSPACSKHAAKVGGEGKGVLHEDTRIIGGDCIKQGWKSDFDAGNIEMEFQAAVNPGMKPVCDVKSPNGFEVTHDLVLEMVVSEEWAPIKKPNQATPTGAARVLRTQFHVNLTERAGLGISWDEEQPPMYEDVPASPPAYTTVEHYDIADLDEVDRLSL